MQCSNVSGIVGRGKTLFFLSFWTWTGDKDKYKNSIGIGKCYTYPKLNMVVKGVDE